MEQGVGVEFGLESNDCIEETGLVGEADRLGGVERGPCDDPAQGFEPRGSGGQGGFRIAGRAGNIGAHADEGGLHVSRLARGRSHDAIPNPDLSFSAGIHL